MTTPGPRTRSQARAEAAGQLSVKRFAGGDAGTPAAADGLHRHGSLIPAYRFQDRVEDLSLEKMLGTPYTVEVTQRTKMATLEPTTAIEQESSFTSIDLSAEEAVTEAPAPEEAPTAPADDTAATAAIKALQITEVPETAEGEEEGFKLASALDALELSAYDSDSGYDEDEEEEEEEAAEEEEIEVGGPLRGVPAPQGTHIRFDDEETEEESEVNGPVVLKGVPPPEGRHVRFDDDE